MGRSSLRTCLALQAVLWWSLCSSQVPGFISIDCGSNDTSTDEYYGIKWVGDYDLISEGTPIPVTGGNVRRVLTTLRLFNGNHSKYCYNVNNSAIKEGSAYLVRVTFWVGFELPFKPQNTDGKFRFKLIVNADWWDDVSIPHDISTWYDREIYILAQGSSIDVCFARSGLGGDAPFVSTLEIRPLPSTLMSTQVLLNSSSYFKRFRRRDYGLPSGSSTGIVMARYPNDTLDRVWTSSILASSPAILNNTNASINSTNQQDKPPATVLQNAYVDTTLTFSFDDMGPNVKYFVEFFFAEIDPAVNAAGQRVFNILVNETLVTTSGPIDIFDKVGPDAAYGYGFFANSSEEGDMVIQLSATTTSIYPSLAAAAELFQIQLSNTVTDASTVSAINDVKAKLNLKSYTGDPCFPIGYEWLNCSQNPNVTSIFLTNYGTGGEIPASLNNLTSLTQIHLDGNALQGEIPELSALTDLETLVLSNNKLTGSIPEYLAKLTSLKVLDLRDNQLSGEIPAALLERKQASTLAFEFSGNPLCETNSGVTCTPSPTSPKKNNSGIIVGVVVAVIVLVGIGIATIVYCLCRNRPLSMMEQPINRLLASPMQELSKVSNSPSSVIGKVIRKVSVQEFNFQEIKVATNNFGTQLGMGGFGPVYKGRLQDGRFVAIKVASNFSHQGSKEFLNEVDLLSRVHHKNLVGLLGYCNEGKLVLVYEFMSNGSLYDCLHGKYAKASPLSWGERLGILIDAAQGLDYLHNGCNPRIIHRDIKSSNVLLNDQLEAKISDFGISRNSGVNETGALPTAVMGSLGYLDPDYLSSTKLTERVDVYSFGVVLFEVVCGKTALFLDSFQQQIYVVKWARFSIDRGMIENIVDPSLHQEYNVSSMWKVVDVALACVSDQRPKMSAVVLELKDAERMERESDQRNVIDKPSAEFIAGSDDSILSLTHVNTR